MRLYSFALLFFSISLASCCYERRRPLPPPGPPVPAPPPAAEPAPAPPQRVWGAGTARAQYPPPAFGVQVLRAGEGGRREIDGESVAFLVNLLGHNGLSAKPAGQAPADLPATIIEAARADAAARAKAGTAGDVFLHGEIAPGSEGKLQVRLAAVDPKRGADIDNVGFEGPPADIQKVLQQSLEKLLPLVEKYWMDPANHAPPAGTPPPK
jgi:hypothetical protein